MWADFLLPARVSFFCIYRLQCDSQHCLLARGKNTSADVCLSLHSKLQSPYECMYIYCSYDTMPLIIVKVEMKTPISCCTLCIRSREEEKLRVCILCTYIEVYIMCGRSNKLNQHTIWSYDTADRCLRLMSAYFPDEPPTSLSPEKKWRGQSEGKNNASFSCTFSDNTHTHTHIYVPLTSSYQVVRPPPATHAHYSAYHSNSQSLLWLVSRHIHITHASKCDATLYAYVLYRHADDYYA